MLDNIANWQYNIWQLAYEVLVMGKDRLMKALAGGKSLPKTIYSPIEVFGLIREGLPYESVERLFERELISPAEIQRFIPPRTLARRKKEHKLNGEESGIVARLIWILDFAEEVFGAHEKAKKWLRTPNRALKGFCPIELLESDYGARIVETLLGRIQHGIYS
jgi:putative toxin-antitoxin system antitoxin component (TIGR02293 family)